MAKRWLLMMMLALLGACAGSTAQRGESSEAARQRAAQCFRIATIDNWRVVDSRQMIVYGPRRDDAWLVGFFATCNAARFAETIAFRARGTTDICGDPGDEILLRGQRCAIRSVRAISPAEAALLLDPAVDGDIGKMPPPERGDGNDQGEDE